MGHRQTGGWRLLKISGPDADFFSWDSRPTLSSPFLGGRQAVFIFLLKTKKNQIYIEAANFVINTQLCQVLYNQTFLNLILHNKRFAKMPLYITNSVGKFRVLKIS